MDTATDMYRRTFPSSDIARGLCARRKLPYIVSDGLGHYFKSKVATALYNPNVFYSLIGKTPKLEQHWQ